MSELLAYGPAIAMIFAAAAHWGATRSVVKGLHCEVTRLADQVRYLSRAVAHIQGRLKTDAN